jgi:hypothetical protein
VLSALVIAHLSALRSLGLLGLYIYTTNVAQAHQVFQSKPMIARAQNNVREPDLRSREVEDLSAAAHQSKSFAMTKLNCLRLVTKPFPITFVSGPEDGLFRCARKQCALVHKFESYAVTHVMCVSLDFHAYSFS